MKTAIKGEDMAARGDNIFRLGLDADDLSRCINSSTFKRSGLFPLSPNVLHLAHRLLVVYNLT